MNTDLAISHTNAISSLPALIDRAVTTLTNARSAAEVLDARDFASAIYDVAKKAARLARAKQAADELIKAAYRAQADALDIEGQAKRRLADEYDAAQERGEVVGRKGGMPKAATKASIGITVNEINSAREIRDAEVADPGIVRRVLDEAIEAGEEPTKAKVRRAVKKAAKRSKPKVRYSKAPVSVDPEPRHDADLRRLEVAWEAACESAREAFIANLGYTTQP